MMMKDVISLTGDFTIRSQVNLGDVSQILTYSRKTTRQWNGLIRNKLLKSQADDITIHICPWEDQDWQQYLALGDRISRLVIWLSDHMELGVSSNENVQIVRYNAVNHSERFVVVSGTGIARALVSWGQPSKTEDDSFLGVFISSPQAATMIACRLDQKIEGDQT